MLKTSLMVKSFEYILMASFWFKVIQAIDDVNKILQFADISTVLLMKLNTFRRYEMISKI